MNSSKFQLIFTGVFAAFILIGVMIFAFGSRGGGVAISQVAIWGTIPQATFTSVFDKSPLSKSKDIKVTYTEKDVQTFDQDLVNALASGEGPDLIFVRQDAIWKNRNRLFTIPYKNYPERTFRDTFAEEGELFLMPDGVIALPFSIDPLVMYWNRDIFTNANLPKPPQYWDEFFDLSQKLTQKDGAFNITRSTAPLGEYQNITNSKEIISSLIMQAGSPIVSYSQNAYRSVLVDKFDAAVAPAQAAVSYYTEFSNPAKPFYTWNRSLPNSQSFFLSGDLGVYFGFASEAPFITLKNPNLNFDIASFPQSRTGARKIAFGRMTGLAIIKNSKSIAGAYTVAVELTGQNMENLFSTALKVPPARRDLLGAAPSDSFSPVFYSSALFSKAWLDPDPSKTSDVFQNVVESVTSGRQRLDGALNQASQEIGNLLVK